MKLVQKFVQKPWGVTGLPEPFVSTGDKIGEIWFTSPEPLPLLAKYIFTSERLSIQVHPDDEQARARGLAAGKTECWYILDAQPGATIGFGLIHAVEKGALREAARNGSIEQLVDWRPVAAGDFLYVPAGTLHAIGSGIALLEFQQNQDVTYRLYDYSRPRELHLDEGLAVLNPAPCTAQLTQHVEATTTEVLVESPFFQLAHALAEDAPRLFRNQRRWVLPIEGEVRSGEERAGPGECLLVEAGQELEAPSGRMIVGAEPSASD